MAARREEETVTEQIYESWSEEEFAQDASVTLIM